MARAGAAAGFGGKQRAQLREHAQGARMPLLRAGRGSPLALRDLRIARRRGLVRQ